MMAVALVTELISERPTVIPAPKLAIVDACAKCVACPVIATERLFAGLAPLCWEPPASTPGCRNLLTVRNVEPETLPRLAEIVVAGPAATPVASPVELIVAVAAIDEPK